MKFKDRSEYCKISLKTEEDSKLGVRCFTSIVITPKVSSKIKISFIIHSV